MDGRDDVRRDINKKLAKCESYSHTKGSVPVLVFVVIAATIIHHP